MYFFFSEKSNNLVTFNSISEPNQINLCANFSYDIELEQSKFLRVCIEDVELAESSSSDWLADNLFNKLLLWAEKASTNRITQKSLSLVSIEDYSQLYHELKIKYGEKLVKVITIHKSIVIYIF